MHCRRCPHKVWNSAFHLCCMKLEPHWSNFDWRIGLLSDLQQGSSCCLFLSTKTCCHPKRKVYHLALQPLHRPYPSRLSWLGLPILSLSWQLRHCLTASSVCWIRMNKEIHFDLWQNSLQNLHLLSQKWELQDFQLARTNLFSLDDLILPACYSLQKRYFQSYP